MLAAVAIGTLWAVPAGLAIGLSPRLSRRVAAGGAGGGVVPGADALSVVIVGLAEARGQLTLDWGSILLMLLGTQWYILFNVIAGAMAVPADLKEAARSYNIIGWQRFKVLYFPALFPFLVTGWVTAAGGAWNASIVAEFGRDSHGQLLAAQGLVRTSCWRRTASRSRRTPSSKGRRLPTTPTTPTWRPASLVMSLVVVVFNRLVWRRCYHLAETRFSITLEGRTDGLDDDTTAVGRPRAADLCEVRGVSHEFPLPNGTPLRVLEDINLAVRPNEVIALLGPSGCGKSTILRILAGLIQPTRGEVLYHGEPLPGLNPGVAIVFQSFALYPWMTVQENIRTVLRAEGVAGAGGRRTGRAAPSAWSA